MIERTNERKIKNKEKKNKNKASIRDPIFCRKIRNINKDSKKSTTKINQMNK